MDAMVAETMGAETETSKKGIVDIRLSQEQIQHLSSLRFINRIDNHLNIVSGVRISAATDSIPHHVYLLLDIYYDDEQIEKLSFNLHNFAYEDIVYIARNIRSNEFILHEVDNILSGDIE
ncbi:hypothetical protein [Kaarinaea lacus]